MNARNIPIPAVTANLSAFGMARTTACRTPITESSTNSTPEMNTAPSAVCQGIFCPSTTVYAKYAFKPIPGACANG